jgi:multicomponent Na+:H+ antiporter subunit D
MLSDWMLLSPVVVFLAAAALMAVVPKRQLGWLTVATPLLSGWLAWHNLNLGASFSVDWMDHALVPVQADALGLLMVGLFHLAALIGALFIAPVTDRWQHGAMLAYFAGGLGVVLAGDWISFFVFFEIIALSGSVLIFARRDEVATASGIRYLLFQIGAGVTVLTGILTHANQSGDWSVGPVALDGLAGVLLLVGFGIKAGFPLVHVWLVDAYPKASMAGLAVLVAVTTKVGVVALLRVFPGEAVLVPIGVVMALWPMAHVLTENNLRRVLAYSMMVQLGLMVVAIGVGTPTALDGVALHIVMDVLFKMTLFMAVALIWAQFKTTDSDRLGGLAQHWPIVAGCVAVASLANMAVPLTGAFISKKLMLNAIEISTLPDGLYWVLVPLSVLGLLYAWVRIFWRVFIAPANRPTAHTPKPIAGIQQIALFIPVLALLVTGLMPGWLDLIRPFGSTTDVFTSKKIIAQLLLLGGAGLVYAVLARLGFGLPRQPVARLIDAEVLYRWALVQAPQTLRQAGLAVSQTMARPLAQLARWMAQPKWPLDHLGQSWSIGAMALWVGVIFAALLVISVINH